MIRMMMPGTLAVLAASASAQIVIPGADGSDGAFNPSGATYTVDLSQAPTAAWDAPNPNPNQGTGVYDPVQWAVVFRYSSVTIPAGTTVKFTNHPKHAPVVWLVNGNVSISGTVTLDGAEGHAYTQSPTYAEPGPGGFRGGRGHPVNTSLGMSAGFGPGGGVLGPANSTCYQGAAGSYATVGTNGGGPSGPTYGDPGLVPLIGGSGGSGAARCSSGAGGGAGGGAILIAVTESVTINPTGKIMANGGTSGNPSSTWAGSGSGGGIRLLADQVTVLAGASVTASGGYPPGGPTVGGDGRIRIEANATNLVSQPTPAPSIGLPGIVFPDAAFPTLRVTLLNGQPISADPLAGFNLPGQDASFATLDPLTVQIEATNLPAPVNSNQVFVHVTPIAGNVTVVAASLSSVNGPISIWTATLPALPNGFSAIQLRAVLP